MYRRVCALRYMCVVYIDKAEQMYSKPLRRLLQTINVYRRFPFEKNINYLRLT